MKNLLRLEEVFLVLLPLWVAHRLPMSGWWFLALFLAPDIGIAGYMAGPKVGAWVYNTLHHRGLAIALFFLGMHLDSPWVQLVGLVMLSHASFDRIFGYGLKYEDSFKHTHLGTIGKSA